MEDGGDTGSILPGGLGSAQMTLVQLLAVLRGYLLCIPETFAEARFDISRLLPEACSPPRLDCQAMHWVQSGIAISGECLGNHAVQLSADFMQTLRQFDRCFNLAFDR